MTLDEQYQKTIDDQRGHLLAVQDNFNKKCDLAKEKAEQKLKEITGDDKEAKEEVLRAQKQELEAALHELKTEVDHSTRETMKRLEDIVHEKEKQLLTDLESQMATL